jgi:hypothetical protein
MAMMVKEYGNEEVSIPKYSLILHIKNRANNASKCFNGAKLVMVTASIPDIQVAINTPNPRIRIQLIPGKPDKPEKLSSDWW